MDPKFFYRVVAPTFVTGGTAFVGITTLGEDVEGKDDVNRLLERKSSKTGRSLMKVIVMDQVCEDCRAAGLAASCKHKEGEIPWWQDASRRDDVEELMAGDHLEDYLREAKGFQMNRMTEAAFDAKAVEECFSEKHDYSAKDSMKHVFVSVDPAAGGACSRFAIKSCIYTDNGEQVVVGAERAHCREPDSQLALLVNHIQAVRKIDGLQSSVAVFAPESNLAFEAMHLEKGLKRAKVKNICVMKEDDNRAGIKINNDLKKLMAMKMRSKISRKKVRFHKNFVCVGQTTTFSRDDMRNETISQMLNFSRIIRPNKDIFKPPLELFSGKRGFGTDDNAIALLINNLMHGIFNKSNKYSEFKSL